MSSLMPPESSVAEDTRLPVPESTFVTEDVRVPSGPRLSRRSQVAQRRSVQDLGTLSIKCELSDEYLQHFLYAFNVEGSERSNKRVVDALRHAVTERHGIEVRDPTTIIHPKPRQPRTHTQPESWAPIRSQPHATSGAGWRYRRSRAHAHRSVRHPCA